MKYYSLSIIFILSFYIESRAQCFSSLNPVAGISNLLVLEKNMAKFICSYNYGLMDKYFEGHKRSDYTLVKSADYNYVAAVLAYGIFDRLTLESEAGYFLNKTYRFENATSKGYGFNNIVISSKFSLVTNHDKRFYCSGSAGLKIPLGMELQKVDLVEVPHELQPSTHAFGYVLQGFMVKENSFRGLRYFLVVRGEYNHENNAGYRYGNFFSASAYLSKHLMYSWVKRDWTTILQLRNEFRGRDRLDKDIIEYTGGYSLLLMPQVNLTIRERWNISVSGKMPMYQYFNGIQLATKFGVIFNVSGDFVL